MPLLIINKLLIYQRPDTTKNRSMLGQRAFFGPPRFKKRSILGQADIVNHMGHRLLPIKTGACWDKNQFFSHRHKNRSMLGHF